MEQHTPTTLRGHSQVLARPTGQLWLQCLLLLGLGFQSRGLQASVNTCSLIITNDHLRYLQEVTDSLPLNSCNVTFTFADIPDRNKDSQHRACYVRRAMSWMRPIFTEQMPFKEQSLNYNRTEALDTMRQTLHNENCFPRETNHAKQLCSRTFSVPPAEMLDMVYEVFKISQELLLNGTNISEVSCANLYEVCPGPKKSNAAITSEQRKSNQKQETLQPKVYMYVLGVCIPALLLAVCGLLYFMHRSRILTRELQRLSGRAEHPEGRPLNRLHSEHLEMVEEV